MEEQPIREVALRWLCTLAINDGDFRRAGVENPEVTLWMYGFALSPREMAEVRRVHNEVAGLGDSAIVQRLREELEPAGIEAVEAR